MRRSAAGRGRAEAPHGPRTRQHHRTGSWWGLEGLQLTICNGGRSSHPSARPPASRAPAGKVKAPGDRRPLQVGCCRVHGGGTAGERVRQPLTEPCEPYEPCEHAQHSIPASQRRAAWQWARRRMTQLRGTEGSPAGTRAGSALSPAAAVAQWTLLQGCHGGPGPGERLSGSWMNPQRARGLSGDWPEGIE